MITSPRHDRLDVDLGERRHAAVAIVVVDSDAEVHGVDTQPAGSGLVADIPGAEGFALTGRVDGTAGGPAVLLTRRATRVRAHAGQWALPGGRLDANETPIDAARRELREELDLQLASARRNRPPLGQLRAGRPVAALYWVHRNAARFGGDPHQMTVAGQSA